MLGENDTCLPKLKRGAAEVAVLSFLETLDFSTPPESPRVAPVRKRLGHGGLADDAHDRAVPQGSHSGMSGNAHKPSLSIRFSMICSDTSN